jgi:hypothetical protein
MRARADSLPSPAEQELIDHDLSSLSGDEISGGWRSICAMILLRTVSSVSRSQEARISKAEARLQYKAAKEWMAGKAGLISFEEVLSALELEEQYVRNGIDRYAKTAVSRAINLDSEAQLTPA